MKEFLKDLNDKTGFEESKCKEILSSFISQKNLAFVSDFENNCEVLIRELYRSSNKKFQTITSSPSASSLSTSSGHQNIQTLEQKNGLQGLSNENFGSMDSDNKQIISALKFNDCENFDDWTSIVEIPLINGKWIISIIKGEPLEPLIDLNVKEFRDFANNKIFIHDRLSKTLLELFKTVPIFRDIKVMESLVSQAKVYTYFDNREFVVPEDFINALSIFHLKLSKEEEENAKGLFESAP